MTKTDAYDGKHYSQNDIDKVWESVWSEHSPRNEQELFSGFLFKSGIRTYKEYIPADQPISVLEIGAGSGRYGFAIAKHFANAVVAITDPVVTSVSAIKALAPHLHLANVSSIEHADATDLEYHDGTYDVVFADAVIQHIVDVDKAMSEAVRVLKPGGMLIISAVNSHNPPHAVYKWWKRIRKEEYDYGYERTYTPSELKNLFTRSGLHDVRMDGFATAYGLMRLRRHYKICDRLGGYLNHVVKLLDFLTGRRITKRFGFMIFAVGVKPYEK